MTMLYKDQFISQKLEQLIYASQVDNLQSFFKNLESEIPLDYSELYKTHIIECFLEEVKERDLIKKLCDYLIYNNIFPSVTQILNTTKGHVLDHNNGCQYATHLNRDFQSQIRHYGRELHESICLYLKGFSIDELPKYLEPWWKPIRPLITDIRTIIDPEFIERATVYSKVESDSEDQFILSYVGRVDCVGVFQGKKYLIDWKFSYSSFDRDKLLGAYLQCSAYCLALKQSFDLDLDGFKIIGVEPNKDPEIWTIEYNSIDFYLSQWIARLKRFLRPGQRIKCSNDLSFRVLSYPKILDSGNKAVIYYKADQFIPDDQCQSISRIDDKGLDENPFEYELSTNNSYGFMAFENMLRCLGKYARGRVIRPYFPDDEVFQYSEWCYEDDVLNSYLESSYYFGCHEHANSLEPESEDIDDFTYHEYHEFLEPEFRDVGLLLNEADDYFKNGCLEESLLTLNTFLKLNRKPENNFTAYKLRGEIYYDLAMFHKSIENYTSAIEIKNDIADLYNKRSSAYIKLGMFQQAQFDLDNALSLLRQQQPN
jgi:tetratricopeptide (TPR) repeat protein